MVHYKKAIAYFAILLSLIAFTIFVKMYWIFTVDDAYITWRYSKHIAEGYGVRWNIDDDPPTEGYTTFFWMLMMVIPHIFSLDPEIFAKTVGVLSMLGTVITAYLIFKQYNKENAILATAGFAIAFLANPITPVHAVSGMETATYIFVLTIVTYLAIRADAAPNKKNTLALSITGFALFLIRPEGAIVAVAVLALLLHTHHSKRNTIIKMWLLGFGIPFLIYNAWRVLHFQQLLPLPFYVKMIEENALVETILWDVVNLGVLAVPILLIVASIASNRLESVERRNMLFFCAICVATLGIYTISAKIMDYSFRYWWPGITIATIAAMTTTQRFRDIMPVIAGALIALILLSTQYAKITEPYIYGAGLRSAHATLGSAISETNAKSGIFGDVGIVPYIADKVHWYDLYGLVTEKFTKSRDCNYMYAFITSKNP